MKLYCCAAILFLSVGGSLQADEKRPAKAEKLKVPVSAIADNLKYIGPSIREKDYTIWGASPVMDDAGKVHLFAARWPEKNVDPAWRQSSEIAHYVADRPEGPFRFVSVVVKGSGVEGTWDRYAPHNPEVKRFGDTYVLVYIANDDYRPGHHGPNQKIGMMTAKSPDGPWTKGGRDGLVLGGQKGHFTEGKLVSNPTIIKVGEKFHLYYKTKYKTKPSDKKPITVYGVAIADKLEGPYVHYPKPVLPVDVWTEDGDAFHWGGKVCLWTYDISGSATGMPRTGMLWVSDDGLEFKRDRMQLVMWLFPRYLPKYDPKNVKRIYDPYPNVQRPKLLLINGRPAYLYAACGFTFDGWPRCENHVFKINLPPNAMPEPKQK